MKKVTDISELPNWFRTRIYRKKLSDVDWYREIRIRQSLSSLISMQLDKSSRISERSRGIFLELLEKEDVRPDALIYLAPQEGIPVRELTVGETTFLAFATQRSDVSALVKEYEKLLELWRETIERIQTAEAEGDPPLTYGKYDIELANFIDQLDDDCKLESQIDKYFECLENPWLSYGRPLNGHPLTIDTQFDDETILQHVKEWLIETRKTEDSKARRPFNQNDFGDWEYYKIREIFDLQTWATLNNTKILDRVMAEALWLNAPDDFSPIDVLRTTARKKTKDIFRFETVIRLYGQLRLAYGENFLTN